MPLVGFQPKIAAGEWLQTYARATWIGIKYMLVCTLITNLMN